MGAIFVATLCLSLSAGFAWLCGLCIWEKNPLVAGIYGFASGAWLGLAIYLISRCIKPLI